MDKKLLITIGYQDFVLDSYGESTSPEVIRILGDLVPVNSNYFENEQVYEPQDKLTDMKFSFILATQVRKATEEEKENKKVKDLEGSLCYAKQENDRIEKEKTCIENELKVLKGEAEEEPEKEVI